MEIVRLTEDGYYRLTEGGQYRLLENSPVVYISSMSTTAAPTIIDSGEKFIHRSYSPSRTGKIHWFRETFLNN